MNILDNARIIKALTDKDDVWSLWHNIEEIKWELERAKHKLECIKEGKDCDDCDLWEEWCSISTDKLWLLPDTETYKRLFERLNLGDLHKWLIDDSTSKEDLQFRLNKIKGIVGSMWSKEDYVQIWCMLHGFEPTSELEIGTPWEIKRGIIPTKSLSNNLYKVATQLNKSVSEDEIDKNVMRLNKVLLDWFKIVGHILHTTYSMIEEAESILNPQPTPTETEPQDPIFDNWDIFEDAWVVSTFQALIKEKIMSIDKGYFRWHWDRSLLLWFCKQMSEYCGLSKVRKGKEQVNWVAFKDMFICQVWDKWQIQSNADLRSAWQDWMKAPQSDNNGKPIPPKGWNIIEGIICKNYKH